MPDLLEHAVEAARNIIPPDDDADPRALRAWRRWIAVAVLMTSGVLGVHILLACGFLSPYYSGFAQAADLKEMQGKVDALSASFKAERIGSLEKDILDTRQKQCAAASGVRALYTSSLQKLMIQYTSLTGASYPIPDCESF